MTLLSLNPEKAEYHRNQAEEIRQRQGEQRKARMAAASEITIPPKVAEGAHTVSVKPEPAPTPQPAGKAQAQTAPPAATDAPQPATPSDESGEPIAVVSGLPRSGTSMLMQMLHAGGQPCLTDGLREADPDNPRGYFEYEKVHRTTDEQLVKLIDFIEYDPYFSKNTTVVIRPEFGRDDEVNMYGAVNHSTGYYQCHRSASIFWGPDFKKGISKLLVDLSLIHI